MAFCTSCGKPLDPAARFCSACGAAMAAGTPAASAPGAAPQPAPLPPAGSGGTSSALKIVLIALLAVAVLGILGTIGATVVGLHIARHSRVQSRGDDATVSTPFGEIKSTHDAAQVARDLGVDVYPGARPLEGGGVVNMPGLHVGGANFESDDSLDKVAEFYRRRFPKASIDVTEPDHQALVVTASRGMVTIDLHRAGDRTEIHLASLGGRTGEREPE